ncbi:MAG: GAF domain-containing protein, partial [Gloeotrichia echinulata HAB0833]
MSISYNNSKKKENNITEIEHIENQNGSINIAIIARDELSTLNAIAEEFKAWREKLQGIVNQMREASDIDTLFKVTVAQIREKTTCDRALIYRFTTEESGTVLAESKTLGWTPALSENLPGIIFGLYTAKDYVEPIAIDDIKQVELTPYQQQLLEKFQIKASLNLPIFVEGKVWGLLIVNNCASMRQWQEGEITLLSQISTELTYRLQSLEFQRELEQQTLIKKSVTKVISKIIQLPDVDKIFQIITGEVRQLLKCDRVAIYRFQPDWSGKFVAESVGNGWIKMVGPDFNTVWQDTYLQETQGGRYAKGESLAVNDIHQAGHSPCHIEILEQFEMRAYIISPIFFGEKLWGLFAAYQNSGIREWQTWEVNFLSQIGLQCGVAISQGEYLQQARIQSENLIQIAEQEKALTKPEFDVRKSLKIKQSKGY